MSLIHPVILSGGSGTRLWPESRSNLPKQLLPLISEGSMLQETVARISENSDFAAPIIVSNDQHRFIIAAQMAEMDITPDAHILEPMGRNTAPAAIVAALHIVKFDPDGLLFLLPADHHIEEVSEFQRSISIAARVARAGRLTTFGIEPDGPETGFGYIKTGPATKTSGAFEIERFVEKPDIEGARRMLKEGGYYWNSGMFMFSAQLFLEEAKRLCPGILEACRESIDKAITDLDFIRLDHDAFEKCPSDSIDYAIMEKTRLAATVPSSFGWSDIGSWSALWAIGERDSNQNVFQGDVLAIDTSSTLVKSENMLVATLGVKDLVIVQTRDAVLVADKSKVQDVKRIVAELKDANRTEHEIHKRVYRPWGYYEGLDEGAAHQVKHICVNPGESLSLQYHHKRAEHWIVVDGVADVVVGEDERRLSANESVYIPIEAMHRLTNPGPDSLHLIEVQTGTYFGEDDIVRVEDIYGRLDEKE